MSQSVVNVCLKSGPRIGLGLEVVGPRGKSCLSEDQVSTVVQILGRSFVKRRIRYQPEQALEAK